MKKISPELLTEIEFRIFAFSTQVKYRNRIFFSYKVFYIFYCKKS